MKLTWILVADHMRARIFTTTPSIELTEVEVLVNMEGRLHDRDLTTDLPGKIKNAEGRRANVRLMEDFGTPCHQDRFAARRIDLAPACPASASLRTTLGYLLQGSHNDSTALREKVFAPIARCRARRIGKFHFAYRGFMTFSLLKIITWLALRFPDFQRWGHAFEQPTDPKKSVAEKFVRRIVKHLENAHNAHKFEQLFLIADPALLGLLRENLPIQIRSLVCFELNKNIAAQTTTDIRKHLPDYLPQL